MQPVGLVWSLTMSVPSGATVICLKLASIAGVGPVGRVLSFKISPVSPSSSTIWFDHASTILPLGRIFRFVLPIHASEVFALWR